MDKKSHIKIAMNTFDTLFQFHGELERLAFIYGSVEPDLNVFTYIKGHGENRVRPYILSSLKELEALPFWGISDFYKAGRTAHYIVDSFTYPHTSGFDGNIKEHVAWEKRIARKLLNQDELLIRRDIGSSLDEMKEEYRNTSPSFDNDILFAFSSLIMLLQKAYSPELAIPVATRKAYIR